MSTQRVETTIMGQSFALTVPEQELDLLHKAVARVDAAMTQIHEAGKVKARDRIAVLAALNIAFDAAQAAQTPQAPPAAAAEAGDADEAAASAPSLSAADAARVAQLLERLDAALGQDGQLL